MLIKRLIKLKLSLALHALDLAANGLRRMLGLAPANCCVVLYYHGVTHRQRLGFERQMRWLAAHRRIVPVAQVRAGDQTHARCCVTFDDALDSVRENALPICRELGIPLSVYAVTGNLGERPRWVMPPGHPDADEPIMTAERIAGLPDDLAVIGSHTVTHRPLAELATAEIADELRQSKRYLEDLLDREVAELSVPYGSFHREVVVEARRAGYDLVLTCEPEVLDLPHTATTVGRFKVTPDDWMIEFRLAAFGAYRWRKWLRHRRRAESSSEPLRPSPGTNNLASLEGRAE